MKRCSTSLAIREMQIKTTMSTCLIAPLYHCINEPKGHQFNSQSEHMPGLQARSLVGGTREATTHWCFSPSLSPSLPLSRPLSMWTPTFFSALLMVAKAWWPLNCSSRGLDKEDAVQICYGILVNHKKRWNIAICNTVRPWEYHAK